MPKIVSSSGKRTTQVKVNFNDDEVSQLDEIKGQVGGDRSSILRESFLKFKDLRFKISKIYNDMNEIYAESVKDTWDPYNKINELLINFDELLERLDKTYAQQNITSTKDEIRMILNSLKGNSRELRQINLVMNKEDAKFDVKMIELIRLLEKFNENSKLFKSETITSDQFETLEDKKFIYITEVNSKSSGDIYRVLDFIGDGFPVIVNYSNIENIKKNEFKNIIRGGAHVAKVKEYPLNDECVLYATIKYK